MEHLMKKEFRSLLIIQFECLTLVSIYQRYFFSYCACYASQPAIRLLSLLALLLDSRFFVTICTDFAEIPVN